MLKNLDLTGREYAVNADKEGVAMEVLHFEGDDELSAGVAPNLDELVDQKQDSDNHEQLP